jgi:hypothetical protein
MKEKNYTGLIPANIEGKEITAEATVQLPDENNARTLYNTAKQRLLYVHSWGNLSGKLSADFQLTDREGKEADRLAEKGDHFRVDIPGPGSKAGEGYDWAFVEDIKEVNNGAVDSIAIRVRPAENPQTSNKNVAHFFSKESTSTFVITREGNTVSACIYDRNIEPNQETKEPLDKIRNTFVGLGAKHGFSKLQWEALANGFLGKD